VSPPDRTGGKGQRQRLDQPNILCWVSRKRGRTGFDGPNRSGSERNTAPSLSQVSGERLSVMVALRVFHRSPGESAERVRGLHDVCAAKPEQEPNVRCKPDLPDALCSDGLGAGGQNQWEGEGSSGVSLGLCPDGPDARTAALCIKKRPQPRWSPVSFYRFTA